MIAKILFLLLYLVAVLSLIYGLWTIVPFFYGLPWIPTKNSRIRKGLEMANLQPGERLYDLGAGDGRVLFVAAEEFGARAVGIEAAWMQYLFMRGRIFFKRKQAQIRVRRENFYQADLSDADVVFAFFTSKQVVQIQENLAAKLKPGTRLIAISADFPAWKPTDFDEGELIFMYEMPPEEGGLMAYLAERDD